jgi:uncharacterized protein YxjI
MTFYMKQKVFSWGDKFTIKDESGADRYFVRGEVFSLGKKLHVYDAQEREVAFVRQKLLSLLLRYDVYVGDEVIMEIRKEFTLLRPRFSTSNGEWRIEGNMWAHEYEIFRGHTSAAHVSKGWWTWGDSYVIDVAPGMPEIPVLACVLAIDAAIEAAQNASNG